MSIVNLLISILNWICDFWQDVKDTIIALAISGFFYWLGNRNAFKQDVAQPILKAIESKNRDKILDCIKEKKQLFSYRFAPRGIKREIIVLEAAANINCEYDYFVDAVINGFCEALDLSPINVLPDGTEIDIVEQYNRRLDCYFDNIATAEKHDEYNKKLKDLLVEVYYRNISLNKREQGIVDSLDMLDVYYNSIQYENYKDCMTVYREQLDKTRTKLEKLLHVYTKKKGEGKLKKEIREFAEKKGEGKLKKEIREFAEKNVVCRTISEIVNVYETEDVKSTYKKLGTGILVSLFMSAIFGGFLFLNIKIGSNEAVDHLTQIIMPYFIYVGLGIAVLLILSYPYIGFERLDKLSFLRRVLKYIALLVIIVAIVCLLPIWGVLGVVELVIRRGARTIDNIQMLGMLLMVDVTIIIVLLSICCEVPKILDSFVWISNKFTLKELPVTLFVIFTFIELVIYGFNKLAIWLYSKKQFKKQRDEQEVQYDVVYMEGVLFKSQIVLLILIFLLGAFSDAEWIKEVETASTDLCNVATVYTLIMLYLDKAREVKNRRYEIGYDKTVHPIRGKAMPPKGDNNHNPNVV